MISASSPSPPHPKNNKRLQALVLLTLQNASVSILTRYSLSRSNYSTSVAVLSTELVKAFISLCMLFWEQQGVRGQGRKGGRRHVKWREILQRVPWRDGIVQMTIPAALYSFQNKLLYTALSNLSAEVYQTTYQLKLVTTAIFSIWFFKTSVSKLKWFSLLLLTLGVVIVQLDKPSTSSTSSSTTTTTTTARDLFKSLRLEETEENRMKGFGAIFLACISSGLAGSYFEKVLKSTPPPITASSSPILQKSTSKNKKKTLTSGTSKSLWIKNLQLSIPSLFFASIGVYFSSSSSTNFEGSGFTIWRGFTPLVWFVVLNQALGGLLVALVVRDSSSIDKGFATSIAIILSTLISWSFDLGGGGSGRGSSRPGGWFLLGAGAVISSTVLYSTSS
ncbi:hypothetical protein JCM5350_002843 [Sporobolomyces pararoseus]